MTDESPALTRYRVIAAHATVRILPGLQRQHLKSLLRGAEFDGRPAQANGWIERWNERGELAGYVLARTVEAVATESPP